VYKNDSLSADCTLSELVFRLTFARLLKTYTQHSQMMRYSSALLAQNTVYIKMQTQMIGLGSAGVI